MADDSANRETIEAYNKHIQAYVDGTPQVVAGSVKAWIDRALSNLPAGATILEIGSGFGRDADYIEAQGFTVERTDATAGFVELLRRQGHTAKSLNALTDHLCGPYQMIFADAVYLHFTPEQARQVLQKCAAALAPTGILAFTVKKGEGSGWKDDKIGLPRFFQFWTAEPLRELVEHSGFKIIELGEYNSSHRDIVWLHVIARPAS